MKKDWTIKDHPIDKQRAAPWRADPRPIPEGTGSLHSLRNSSADIQRLDDAVLFQLKKNFSESPELHETKEGTIAKETHWETLYKTLRGKSAQNICALDPLGVDDLIHAIPQYNQNRDLRSLKDLLNLMLPSLEQTRSMSYNEAAAAMRDIGILLGSIKRHGVEPASVAPGLEAVLFLLAEKLNLPPRDTLISYVLWNPAGARERSYTDAVDEHALIHSVRIAMLKLEVAIFQLKELHHLPPESGEFAELCMQTIHNFHAVVEGLVHARRNVSPEFFARELRAYYDEISLRGKNYLGPGAVEMPMFIFDHLLWSSDQGDERHRKFKEGYLPYVFPQLREVYREFEGKNSLIGRLSRHLETTDRYQEGLITSVRLVLKLGNVMKSFRLPHKKMAEQAYQTKENTHHHGSGGYDTEVLSYILGIMDERLHRLKKTFVNYLLHST